MTSRNPGRCVGSAMTEFSVLTLVMIPLLFAIPMIGKLIDVRQTAVMASRYAAWENTVSSGIGGAGHIGSRFFSEPSTPLVSNNTELDRNTLWGGGDVNDQLNGSVFGAVSIDPDSASAPMPTTGIRQAGVSYSLGRGVEKAGDLLDWAPDTQWGLTGDGLINAVVQVDVENNKWLTGTQSQCGSANNVFACVTESNAIMVDGWSSGSDAQARQRVRSLVPASGLTKVGNIMAHMGRIPVFKELRRLEDAFGHVDMNVLPDGEAEGLQSYAGDS